MADIKTQYIIDIRSQGGQTAAKDLDRLTVTADQANRVLKQLVQQYDKFNRVVLEAEIKAGQTAKETFTRYTNQDAPSGGFTRVITDYQRGMEKLRSDIATQGTATARTFQQKNVMTTPQGIQESIKTFQQFGDQIRPVSELVTLNGKVIKDTSIQYGEFNGRLVETGRKVDDVTRNLDKQSTMFDHLRRRFQFIAEWMLFQEVLNLTAQAMNSWVTEQRLMSSELAEFDIITRGAVSGVEAYNEAINAISRRTGLAPGEAAQGVLAQLRVPYAPQDAALRGAEVQRVTGMDNVAAQRELIGLTIQTGLNSTQVLDRFAGAMRRSTLGAEELFGMLETAGPLAQQFNTSFDRILGMIAGTSTVTGEAGNSIELLMRQLNRLYTDPQSKAMAERITGKPVTSMVNGAEVRRDLYDVLGEIAAAGPQAIQDFAETFPNVLGQKNQQLLIGMLKGWDNVREAVESTEESVGLWGDSVERHMDTVTASIEGVGSAWQRLLRMYDQSDSIINFLQTYADLLNSIADAKDLISRGELLLGVKSDVSLNPLNTVRRTALSAANALPENRYTDAFKGILNNPLDPLLDLLVNIGVVSWPERQRQNALENAPNYSSLAPTGLDRWERERARVMASPEYQQEQLRRVAQQAGASGSYVSSTSPGGPLPEARVTVPGGIDVQEIRRAYRGILDKEIAALGAQPRYTGYNNYELEKMVDPAESQVALAFVTEFGEVLQITTGDVDRFNLAVKQVTADVESRGIDPETGQRIFGRPITVTNEQRANFRSAWNGDLDEKVTSVVIEAGIEERTRSFVDALGMTEEAARKAAEGQQVWIPIVDEAGNALFAVYASADNASAALLDLTGATSQLAISILSLPTVGGVRVGFEDYVSRINTALDQIETSGVLDGVDGERTSTKFIDPFTLSSDTVTATRDELALAQAMVGGIYGDLDNSVQTGNDYARESRDLLRSIASSTASFASSLLGPTQVTEDDVWATQAGTYQDKWDEPVRRIRDVMERRKSMNPDLGKYAGLAGEYGIDLSSIESTMATGNAWINRFYSGQLDPAFYEANSKEGFLNAARTKMDEQKGRDALQAQAVGWLTEAGISDEIAKQVAREQAGNVSPLESILLGGKTPEAVGKDIKASTAPVGTGIVAGVNDAIAKSDLAKALESGFGAQDQAGQTRLSELGYSVGIWIVQGVGQSFKDKLLGVISTAVYEMVMAELEDE